MIQSMDPVHAADLNTEYDDISYISNTKCEVRTPHSVNDETNWGSVDDMLYSNSTNFVMRPVPTTPSLYYQHGAINPQGSFTNETSNNKETVFRFRHVRSLSEGDISDERIIDLSRPVNPEDLTARDKHEYHIL